VTLSRRAAFGLALVCAVAAPAAALRASAADSTLPVPRTNLRPLDTAVVDPETFGGRNAAVGLARTRSAGATFVRLTLDWRVVAPGGSKRPRDFHPANPADPAYNWAAFDRDVRLALDRGLEPLVTVTDAPVWALRRDTNARNLARADAGDFAQFALAAARRYRGTFEDLPRLRYWQAWNEPNHPGRAALKAGAADWYRNLVNRFAAAVHGVDPTNEVIAGGCSPFTTETAVGPLFFMRQVLAKKIAFDVWSHHPYTSGGPTHHANGNGDVSLGDLPEMQSVLRQAIRAGHVVSKRNVRFWVTEFAWDTDPPDPQGVPLGLQTRWTAEALYRMWEAGVSLVTWWRIRDDPLRTSFYQSGLYFRGATIARDRPKRTLYAFRFPFVAFAENGRAFVWGRTPAGRPGKVAIEQRTSGGWSRLGILASDRYGIFSQLYATSADGAVRARLLAGGDVSVPFSLQVPPDRFYYPFGS
jgi:hypothetical protein